MDGWHVALYAFAGYAALRSLVGLMKAHERDYRRKLAREAATEKAKAPPTAAA